MPIPAAYLLADRAPLPRTLCDVLAETARTHPDAPAIDDSDAMVTYSELIALIRRVSGRLSAIGVGRGHRVGIRMPSGSRDLYLAILATLWAGAAYVPVDADDPDERARLVFDEADVDAIIDADGIHPQTARVATQAPDGPSAPVGASPATPSDDAWIIFTSGSTGKPKGVAVTHRNAAAFVDAEAALFLQDAPLGPGDRVLAGLSVAFDASCEEMWLAWRSGACLVPAPRALVRSGMDLGPWLVKRDINVVSTVPTLASMWPAEALEMVRLLIFGGESCPPELADRLATADREVWNTYGPTEATVVACAAPLRRGEPVRIGLPLIGWDLAVVDANGEPVADGESGELVIGGVGLARYLDPVKDAEKYAPAPALGWDRAYRSGDIVTLDSAGLLFVGRADDQVKIGGRRIELGEIDNALQSLPGVSGAAVTVRTTESGNAFLVGYLASTDPDFDVAAARARLQAELPAALVPRLVLMDELPTRTSGKVDRDALPWPAPGTDSCDEPSDLSSTEAWLAQQWSTVLGVDVSSPTADFFAEGGGSLSAAQLVTALRSRYPEITVAALYDHPRLGSLAEMLDALDPTAAVEPREVKPVPFSTGVAQTVASVPLATLTGVQWVTWLGVANNVADWAAGRLGYDAPWLISVNWWALLIAFGVFVTPVGRMTIAAIGARLLLHGVTAGRYPRGGSVHVRLWIAERLMAASGAHNLSGAPWMPTLARALGARIGDDVDLHSLPPVTGLLRIGDGAAVEPEVDLAGWWLDGDVLIIGEITVKPGAVVGSRSTLFPGAVVGRDAIVDPGSGVTGKVKARQRWGGSPAMKLGKAKPTWPAERPKTRRWWVAVYGGTALVISAGPLISLAVGLAVAGSWAVSADRLRTATWRMLALAPVGAVAAMAVFALLTLIGVRLASIRMTAGTHPVRSRVGWQVWATERMMDAARTYLFPLYASLLTPWWFRALGASIGTGTEISTALVVPKFTTVGDDSFLADDTLVASYELGGGWMRVGEAKIGKRAFLGNSGMIAPDRKVPKNGLVAVLSAAPSKAKNGSSWLGSPPVRLRRTAAQTDSARTFAPTFGVRAARATVETLRLTAVMVSFAIGVCVLFGMQIAADKWGVIAAVLLSGVILLAAGAVAGAVTCVAKWTVVGPIRPSEHPLWSSFVWRNELSDAFVETVAAPWFANAATGTPALTLWLRSLGATIGRGVWCESYWLPEADLVELGDGANVQRGCVVQTHLFHDRVMAIDHVRIGAGATLGPHCVALPASGVGESATVGPASLVMRGDVVPDHTVWQGNPIAPWTR
ncbi:amino acid adenylation domain-containing protein [Gordonia sp. HY285]|uniref:Pls/PosA family non-ribosomal peptide synthetase n=1 Tax=Gordonia liuliyuniae TaxID=2911517 RepID=UPI001F3D9262|nr:Pls/PosA family non-ribosomal peptide synthetase [Gordonia liuliyuniae]MCF8609466.1 amino acid adenylation domain-containing protein [Gordonia liuliyuniae]